MSSGTSDRLPKRDLPHPPPLRSPPHRLAEIIIIIIVITKLLLIIDTKVLFIVGPKLLLIIEHPPLRRFSCFDVAYNRVLLVVGRCL